MYCGNEGSSIMDFWYQVPGKLVDGGLRRLFSDDNPRYLMACMRG